jgi:Putative zinc-binding metallo-peptidase
MDENRFDRARARFFEKYRIDIVRSGAQFPLFPLTILQGQGKIHGAKADPSNVESYWPLFLSEWNVYPAELMAKTRMKHIILCQDLAYEASPSRPQLRAALPDLEYTSAPRTHLYLDVARGRDDELYVREVIHHEFFHIIDWCDDRSLDRDDVWRALNPPEFTYGTGGAAQQENPFAAVLTEDEPGFLNPYAMSGLEEDKAEIFAYMVVARQYMAERAMRDDIIRKKMHTMAERLQAFCPQLDDQFWNRAGVVERPNVQPRIVERPIV